MARRIICCNKDTPEAGRRLLLLVVTTIAAGCLAVGCSVSVTHAPPEPQLPHASGPPGALYVFTQAGDVWFEYLDDLGLPGGYPFTRAITPTLYRSNLWRISQYSGYATPEESNDLWKAQIQTGLNTVYIAYDLPTQLGYDPDDPRAEGEVGRVGISLISLKDWERAFDGIDIEDVVVSQVLNAPGPIVVLHDPSQPPPRHPLLRARARCNAIPS